MAPTKKCTKRRDALANSRKKVTVHKKIVKAECTRPKPAKKVDGVKVIQCTAKTLSLARCKRYSVPGTKLCFQHTTGGFTPAYMTSNVAPLCSSCVPPRSSSGALVPYVPPPKPKVVTDSEVTIRINAIRDPKVKKRVLRMPRSEVKGAIVALSDPRVRARAMTSRTPEIREYALALGPPISSSGAIVPYRPMARLTEERDVFSSPKVWRTGAAYESPKYERPMAPSVQRVKPTGMPGKLFAPPIPTLEDFEEEY
uniref:Uncharacterized protein n=1 Tax=viral metagenome TaxID=1070528 RepID=A0A6C0LZ01_9ZZZZ